ncbi:MAG TPA: DUF4476 domain-containing protein [Gemmatales bacterium]|nr:DUF4476 domain-containing protein [Gemmatales bacterium]
MSKFICCLTCLLSITLPCQAQFASDRQKEQPKPTIPDGNTQMLKDLQEARELLKRVPPSGNRDRIELLLTRTELQLKQILGRMGDTLPKPKVISNEDFNRLSVSMRNQAFDKDKYQFMENFVAGRHFTCDQASQLLKHFSFDADRIKGAVLLYPQLIDPENFNRVLEPFAFETSRKAVMERVKGR